MWFPSLEETFVFRHPEDVGQTAVIIIPGGKQPLTLIIEDTPYVYDDEATEKVRMFIRVYKRAREEEAPRE